MPLRLSSNNSYRERKKREREREGERGGREGERGGREARRKRGEGRRKEEEREGEEEKRTKTTQRSDITHLQKCVSVCSGKVLMSDTIHLGAVLIFQQ